MNRRRWGCIGVQLVPASLLIIGATTIILSGWRVAATIMPNPGAGAEISWQPTSGIASAYAERIRLWPPSRLVYQDQISLPGWPSEEVPPPGQRVSLHDLQAKPGDCYQLVEGYAEPGPNGQQTYRYQHVGIVCWLGQ